MVLSYALQVISVIDLEPEFLKLHFLIVRSEPSHLTSYVSFSSFEKQGYVVELFIILIS